MPHPLRDGLSTEQMRFDKDVWIPMGDGSRLCADVFRPPAEGRYPVVMHVGAYVKDVTFQEWTPALYATSPEQGPYMTWERLNPESWVADGYVIVNVDQTGMGKSPGVADPWSPRDVVHHRDAIEWAAAQPWSNGRVGLVGASFWSSQGWDVAALQPPGLAAIVPWEIGWSPYLLHYDGGIFENAVIDASFASAIRPHQWRAGEADPSELDRYLVNAPAVARAHPLFDDYWRARTPDLERIEVPMLALANSANDAMKLRQHVAAFERVSSEHKWLRIHGGDWIDAFYNAESRAEIKRFLDCFLLGEDNGQLEVPPLRIAVRSRRGFTFRHESSWPLAATRWERWHLSAADASVCPAPPAAEAEVSFSAEPVGAPSAADLAAGAMPAVPEDRHVLFRSEPFARDTEITGPMALTLTVSASLGDADIFVAIWNETADGRLELDAENGGSAVAHGWLRLSHRELDVARSKEWLPVHPHTREDPPAPDEVVRVEIEVGPTTMVFDAGTRLVVDVGSCDLDPAGVRHDDPVMRRGGGTVTLYTGGADSASILIPLIDPSRQA